MHANTSQMNIADNGEQLTDDFDLYGQWQLQGFPLYQHLTSKAKGLVHSVVLIFILWWLRETIDTWISNNLSMAISVLIMKEVLILQVKEKALWSFSDSIKSIEIEWAPNYCLLTNEFFPSFIIFVERFFAQI